MHLVLSVYFLQRTWGLDICLIGSMLWLFVKPGRGSPNYQWKYHTENQVTRSATIWYVIEYHSSSYWTLSYLFGTMWNHHSKSSSLSLSCNSWRQSLILMLDPTSYLWIHIWWHRHVTCEWLTESDTREAGWWLRKQEIQFWMNIHLELQCCHPRGAQIHVDGANGDVHLV